MSIEDLIGQLLNLGLESNIGRGPAHPSNPKPEATADVDALLNKYQALYRFPDYLEFVNKFGGAEIYTEHRSSDHDFVSVTIYGAGPWEFTDLSDTALTPCGEYYVFGVVDFARAGESNDITSSFAFKFSEPSATGVYAEIHDKVEAELQYFEYCSSFTEWLEILVREEGFLIPK